MAEELVAEADLGGEVARKLLGELAYRSGELEEELAELGIAVVTNEASARRPGVRQQIEIAFSSLKRTFGLSGRPWPPLWWDWPQGSQPR